MIRNVFNRGRVIAASAVLGFAMLATAATSLVGHTQGTRAASLCNPEAACNVVWGGLSGSTDQQYINSFQDAYRSGTDGHGHNDLKAVYANWMGASEAMVNGMTTANTQIGTVYKDGHITVNGKTVGTSAVVTARFTLGNGFSHVEGNVYSRATTTYEYYPTEQAIVYMQNGQMVFFVEIPCGNAGRATPVTPPKPPVTPPASEVCNDLTFTKNGNGYTFTATGNAQNTTITGYTFTFGDGSSTTVPTNGTSATTSHTYSKPGTYTAIAAINTTAKNGVTSANCAKQITIPQPECKPGVPEGSPQCNVVMTCNNLVFSAPSDNTQQVTFTVDASGQNVTIDSYHIDFGDGSTPYNGAAPSTLHNYPATNQTYAAVATVTFTNTLTSKQQTVSSDKCKVQVPVTIPMCTVPGKENFPVGSPQCTTPPPATPPTVLPSTGPGDVIGVFAGVSLAGAAAHYFFGKRRDS